MGSSEYGIFGQRNTAKHHQRVEQLVDSRLAQLREGRMGGAATRSQLDAQHATRRDAQPVVRWLAVDQKPDAFRRVVVRDARAVAATLLPRDEEHRNPRLPSGAKPFDGPHLRRQNPLGITRSAAEDDASLLTRRRKRRHAVEMRRKDNARGSIELGEYVEASLSDRLLGNAVPEITKKCEEPRRDLLLTSGGGVDVDEIARELFDGARRRSAARRGYRNHRSSSVRASVRSSRYLTTTGVASDRPHSLPAPTVTARAPGTTTAPSGTISGCPASGLMMRPFGRS